MVNKLTMAWTIMIQCCFILPCTSVHMCRWHAVVSLCVCPFTICLSVCLCVMHSAATHADLSKLATNYKCTVHDNISKLTVLIVLKHSVLHGFVFYNMACFVHHKHCCTLRCRLPKCQPACSSSPCIFKLKSIAKY